MDSVAQEQVRLNEFLIDYCNEGHYFKLTIEGDTEDIKLFLHSVSNDVRFLGIRDRKVRGKKRRHLPCGVIHSCRYMYDKINTFVNRRSMALPDERHHILEEKSDEG